MENSHTVFPSYAPKTISSSVASSQSALSVTNHENSNFSSALQSTASSCILFPTPPPPPPSCRTLLLLPPSPPSCALLETKGSHQPIDHANLPCDPLPNDGPQKNQVCSVLSFVCSLPVLLRAALWYSQQVAHLASAAAAAQRVETYILL